MGRLLVASNRGPVEFSRADDGSWSAERGSGGLVTALGGALQSEEGTWISVALSDSDRGVAAEHKGESFSVDVEGGAYSLRMVDVGDLYEPYYNEVANRLLWFTVHGLWGAPYEPLGLGWREPWRAYQQVNERVAEAVVAAAGDDEAPEVHLQDYHLCTAARAIRARLPGARILHYLHTPWAGITEWGRLPEPLVTELFDGLLAADVIGISSPAWAAAVRRSAARAVGATQEDHAVVHRGRRTEVATFVLGVDEAALRVVADSEEAAEEGRKLEEECGDRALILRVDRTDLSKNILRGLLAYEALLDRHPEHRGRVWHYAHLSPSRQGVPEYRAYLEAVQKAAGRIEERFGAGCLYLNLSTNYPLAMAAFQRYDVLLTNPVRDGTNLVAKEGPTLNERDGVLVLGRDAGAADVLADGALLVNGHDVEEQVDALHRALVMPAAERAERAAALRQGAQQGAPGEWFAAQRATLNAATSPRVVVDHEEPARTAR